MGLQTMLRRKPLDHLGGDDTENGAHLRRVLTKWNLISIGVAATIGTGLFVLIGPAINNSAHLEMSAGPSIILSFVLCGVALLLVAFPYAELSSMIPISGSAYTYAYVALGELVAWIIGWDLILEYAFGASAVAVGWSSYLQGMLDSFGITLPGVISHAPENVPWLYVIITFLLLGPGALGTLKCLHLSFAATNRNKLANNMFWLLASVIALAVGFSSGVYVLFHLTSVDLPAILIVVALSYFLMKGVEHTAKMTGIFVLVKLAVITLFVLLGVLHFNPSNLHPFMPNGLHGMMAAAGAVFFAFIGFDAITCHAEECKNPQDDMKWGIMGSLILSTGIYIVVGAIMVGGINYVNLIPQPGHESQEGAAFITFLQYHGYNWAIPVLAIGIIASITSVLIVMLSSQARIMMRMSKDGLVVPFFSKVHPKYQTPHRSIWSCGLAIAAIAGLLPISELAELTSIGTLAAFILVCVGVIVLRKTEPNRLRKFRCPDCHLVPLAIAIAGVVSLPMLIKYGVSNTWMLVTLVIVATSLVLWLMYIFLDIQWIPAGGALISLSLMVSLPGVTWLRFVLWLMLGIGIYFCYGRKRSLLARGIKSRMEITYKSQKT